MPQLAVRPGKFMKGRNEQCPVRANTRRPTKHNVRVSACLTEGIQCVFVFSKARKCVAVTATSDDESLSLKHILRTEAHELLKEGPGFHVTARGLIRTIEIFLECTDIDLGQGQIVPESEHIWIFSDKFLVGSRS